MGRYTFTHIMLQLMTKVTYLVASDVAKLIDGNEFVQVRPHDNSVAIAGRLQNPDLFLFQGLAVGIDLVAESFSAQVLELAVDEADGPAASVGGSGSVGLVPVGDGAGHGCNWR